MVNLADVALGVMTSNGLATSSSPVNSPSVPRVGSRERDVRLAAACRPWTGRTASGRRRR